MKLEDVIDGPDGSLTDLTTSRRLDLTCLRLADGPDGLLMEEDA
jgi:hypothetical protein